MKRLFGPVFRIGSTLVVGLALVAAVGCNRPSESDCEEAIQNIRELHEAEPATDAEIAAAVRSCRGNATKKSVRCFKNAETIDELKDCEGDMFDKMFGDEQEGGDADGNDAEQGDEGGEAAGEGSESEDSAKDE